MLGLLAWVTEGHPFTAADVARTYGISRRTALRDLDTLRDDWGVPVAYDPVGGAFRATGPVAAIAPIPVAAGDLAAFLVARHALDALGDGITADTLAQVTERLAALLPNEVHVESSHFARHTRVLSGARTAPRPQWQAALHHAIAEQRVVDLRYHSATKDEISQRRVEPAALVLRAGRWYLLAYCHRASAWRDFRLDRIETMEVTNALFDGRPFDLDDALARRFGMTDDGRTYTVHVRFSSYQARWIREEVWHPTQVVTECADGSLDLSMEVEGLEEVARWVLSYGPEAEVLAPSVLRDLVSDRLHRASESYRRAGSPTS